MAIEQAGFTKGRGTRDQISNLRWIMERSTEYQRPIYMCFIDYRGFSCDVRRSRDFLVYSILEVKPPVPGHFRNADHSC